MDRIYSCIKFYRGYLIIEEESGYLTSLSYSSRCEFGEPSTSLSHRLSKLISRYEEGFPIDFRGIPISFRYGSEFDIMVWTVVRKIPYGGLRTYKWVAERVLDSRYSRVVGRSLSKNPILIVVPCHRIIKSDYTLGGFTDGVEFKKYLLTLEGHDIRDNKVIR
ncbi:hypothetical protein DRN84_03335 [Candidatus Geothermarchaeota archaeon]|nr:MAG: hypothetical protein DRN84_03335 [Candidatus Geothermarchaeota archaeon]